MILPSRNAPFINAVSVEAWDAWFRWRTAGELRDISIEDTWLRVASALAAPDSSRAVRRWRDRFLGCLADWRVLPDERLLAYAGTGYTGWSGSPLVAALNAAAFVQEPGSTQAWLDIDAIEQCAAWAVRMLDNALLVTHQSVVELRIGVVGLSDALLLLGLGYDTLAGRTAATAMVAALQRGCRDASMRLARERGSLPAPATPNTRRALHENPGLQRTLQRHGARHTRLTAITSQPRLAMLANHVSDALDPAHNGEHAHRINTPGGTRVLYSSGYAQRVLSSQPNTGTTLRTNTLATLPWQAQLRMRLALQPHIDAPIDYPLLLPDTVSPNATARAEAARFAANHGLAKPTWRNTSVVNML